MAKRGRGSTITIPGAGPSKRKRIDYDYDDDDEREPGSSSDVEMDGPEDQAEDSEAYDAYEGEGDYGEDYEQGGYTGGYEEEEVEEDAVEEEAEAETGENFGEKATKLWQTIKDAVSKDGRPISFNFLKRPDKKIWADYYRVIQKPIALDDIKKKIDSGKYPNLEAVRADFELCFTNAKTYNQPDSEIYSDAKDLLKLTNKTYRKLTPQDENGHESKPPSLKRLLNSRMQKLIKKTDDTGRILSTEFMELPSRAVWPGYYTTISKPRCLETIQKQVKRKDYQSASEFATDVELVFSNAMAFNQEHSLIWEDALALRTYFRELMSDLPPPHALPQYSSQPPLVTAPKIRLKIPTTTPKVEEPTLPTISLKLPATSKAAKPAAAPATASSTSTSITKQTEGVKAQTSAPTPASAKPAPALATQTKAPLATKPSVAPTQQPSSDLNKLPVMPATAKASTTKATLAKVKTLPIPTVTAPVAPAPAPTAPSLPAAVPPATQPTVTSTPSTATLSSTRTQPPFELPKPIPPQISLPRNRGGARSSPRTSTRTRTPQQTPTQSSSLLPVLQLHPTTAPSYSNSSVVSYVNRPAAPSPLGYNVQTGIKADAASTAGAGLGVNVGLAAPQPHQAQAVYGQGYPYNAQYSQLGQPSAAPGLPSLPSIPPAPQAPLAKTPSPPPVLAPKHQLRYVYLRVMPVRSFASKGRITGSGKVGRTVRLDHRDGVSSWFIRLERGETKLCVWEEDVVWMGERERHNNVHVHDVNGGGGAESSDEDEEEADDVKVEQEQEEQPKKRGRGRPPKNPKAVSVNVSPAKKVQKKSIKPKKPDYEETVFKVNGSVVSYVVAKDEEGEGEEEDEKENAAADDDGKGDGEGDEKEIEKKTHKSDSSGSNSIRGRWEIELVVGNNTVELGEKGSALVWKVYVERV